MSNVETVQTLYEAFAAKDLETIRKIMHPEIEWFQMDGFPMGGRHVGIENVFTEVFAQFRVDWDRWGAIVDEYLDAGDTVVALGYYTGTYKHTGKSMRAAFAHCYTLRGGQIVKFVQYTDTLKVAQARL